MPSAVVMPECSRPCQPPRCSVATGVPGGSHKCRPPDHRHCGHGWTPRAGEGLAFKGSVHRYLGLLARTTGDLDAAEHHLTRAFELHRMWQAAPLADRTRRELTQLRTPLHDQPTCRSGCFPAQVPISGVGRGQHWSVPDTVGSSCQATSLARLSKAAVHPASAWSRPAG
jgi:hypothetical protein